MKSSKNFRLFTSIALITLMVSLMFPAVALADDGTAPPAAAPAGVTASSGAATDPASPDAQATQVAQTQPVDAPSTDVSATQQAATQAPAIVTSADNATQPATTQAPVSATSIDTSATQPAATSVPGTVTSTDVAAQPAATQTSSTAVSDSTVTADATETSTVTALADSGSVLTDQNGNPIPLASAQAAEILGQSLPDPAVCPAGSTSISAGCSHYTTITDAINNALPGSVIFVESGTYTEQVVINESLTLIGAGSASTIIQAPSTWVLDPDGNQDIVLIEGSGTIANISGFTITGPGPSGCDSINYGIYVRGGATANIHNNVITNIRDNPLGGCQNGVAIRVGSKALGQTGTAKITNNTISDYQKGGIVIDNTGSYADIEGNVVEGAGETTAIAQNGIQISRGATATLINNTIEDNLCDHVSCGPDASQDDQSAGILLYQSGDVTVQGNTISNNDLGLYSLVTVLGSSASVTQNTFEDNRYENILADQGTLNLQNNTITGSNYGVWAYSFLGDTGNTIVNLTGNQISNALVAGIRLDKDAGDPYNPVVNGSGNSFVGNPKGVINNTTTLADFVGNWWDSSSGPMDNKHYPDVCGLNQNNPSGTGNGVSPCVLYDPWSTVNPFAASGGSGSSGSAELSSLIIPVTGGQPATISCVDPSEMFQVGDVQVTFTGLCNYEVVLDQLSKDSLPGNLSQGNNFVEGISMILLKDEKAVDTLPAGASIQVSYPNPSGNASILAWINSSWVEKPSSVIDDRVVANLDKPAINVIVTH